MEEVKKQDHADRDADDAGLVISLRRDSSCRFRLIIYRPSVQFIILNTARKAAPKKHAGLPQQVPSRGRAIKPQLEKWQRNGDAHSRSGCWSCSVAPGEKIADKGCDCGKEDGLQKAPARRRQIRAAGLDHHAGGDDIEHEIRHTGDFAELSKKFCFSADKTDSDQKKQNDDLLADR